MPRHTRAAGVLLDDPCAAEAAPATLFDVAAPGSERLTRAMGRLNARFGRDTVFPAAMGVERGWRLRAAHRSPRYTARIEELPRLRA